MLENTVKIVCLIVVSVSCCIISYEVWNNYRVCYKLKEFVKKCTRKQSSSPNVNINIPIDILTEVSKHLEPCQLGAFRLSCKEGKRLIDIQSKYSPLVRGIQRLPVFKIFLDDTTVFTTTFTSNIVDNFEVLLELASNGTLYIDVQKMPIKEIHKKMDAMYLLLKLKKVPFHRIVLSSFNEVCDVNRLGVAEIKSWQ